MKNHPTCWVPKPYSEILWLTSVLPKAKLYMTNLKPLSRQYKQAELTRHTHSCCGYVNLQTLFWITEIMTVRTPACTAQSHALAMVPSSFLCTAASGNIWKCTTPTHAQSQGAAVEGTVMPLLDFPQPVTELVGRNLCLHLRCFTQPDARIWILAIIPFSPAI